jgi:hypothetical protein
VAVRAVVHPFLGPRQQRQQPFVHVVGNRLLAPGAQLTDGCDHHGQPTPTGR